MDLILWRHAEAVDGVPDLERGLTARGVKQAERMARWLERRLPEGTRVLSSPAQRARQTALAFVDTLDFDERLAPGATPGDLLAASGWPNGDGSVLIVGHQPTLGRVAGQLLTGRATDWPIRKGAIVWLRGRRRDDVDQVVLRAALTPQLI